MLNIAVILGSTREGRFGEKPARWIYGELAKRKGVEPAFIDLRDHKLPFFNKAMAPGYIKEPYGDEAVARWTQAIGAQDGFVVVAPEYNRSVGGEMKNAFDWVYREWNRKAAGFVAYGSVGGARAVEHMRLIAIELQMAPIRHGVHLPMDLYMSMVGEEAPVDPALFAPVRQMADTMLDQLVWWTGALKEARDRDEVAEAA
ncbi:MAG: NAD(P)H-dependent oxidoreductase [Bauldia sp.]|uniref:NADPH-dependent FMN reductase n=1 Tax=Bauldia sp. TaxID=2575872 RepID=UPI001D35B7BB|nr:NAD(P)H-dependent oxidoreductase [Bauldia sp.]MCB1497191.1 NAD(P)H-dependent oxidoreductase [Bauldia sp.]